jgi:Flp pilus assembly protein TadG
MPLRPLGRNQNGGVLAEVSILIPIIFVLLLGAIDFLFVFYQWNAAAKAVEVGARIAALSDPVATNLANVTSGLSLGTQWPTSDTYTIKCDGSTSSCTCTGTCTGWTAGYNSTAMSLIIFGRDGNGLCGDAASYYYAGMCDIFGRINSASYVVVTYTQTGLGYAGRPMPVPTITVSLQNLPFHFFFLSGLLGFTDINIPAQATTITGEALSSLAP